LSLTPGTATNRSERRRKLFSFSVSLDDAEEEEEDDGSFLQDECILPVRGGGGGDGRDTAHGPEIGLDEKAVLGATSDPNACETVQEVIASEKQQKSASWPCGDALDRRLIKIALPVIANSAISPLIGAVDLFWVNRMSNALAVAGQAAANQVFNSVFWLTSFLPSVTATLIAKQNAAGNEEGIQDAVCQALFVGIFMATLATVLLMSNPEKVLMSVLPDGAPALEYAKPYLLIRAMACVPSLVSLVGFSAFRGILDTLTPVKISSFANVFNAVLDPILIFTLAMGVPGAALATLAAEVVSAVTYMVLLKRRNLIRWKKLMKPPSLGKLEPLLRGGAALQLRNIALNISFLAVARVTQSIDTTGVAAAAHAMAIQVFQVGGIVLLAMSTVSQTVVPNDLVERVDPDSGRRIGGKEQAVQTVKRLMSWGLLLGVALGAMQLALLPIIRKSTPLQEVRDAARVPAILASILQVINGLVFIGEGIMVGTGSFLQLSFSTVLATGGLLWALKMFPPIYGLSGVWIGFGVFNSIRLLGVWFHQHINGPLARQNLEKKKAQQVA
jgi:putative MATE family efflux protein